METTPVSLLQKLRDPATPAAWQRFVFLYEPLLDRWAGRLGLQEADRADLVQEVLLALLRALPAFEHDSRRSFRGWLHTIAINKWKDFRKKRVPAPMANDDGRWDTLTADDPVAGFVEAEYRSFIVGRALHLFKAEFQPATWSAFWATAVDGQPAEDVARELGLTANAVYLARGRILRRLRVELNGLFE